MRTLLISMGLLCTVITGLAQCPSRLQLHTELQPLLSNRQESASVVQQQTQLRSWLGRWQRCHGRADSSYVAALNQLAQTHIHLNDLPPAIRYLREAIELYKKPSLRLKTSALAMSYYRLGANLIYTNEEEQSIQPLLKATEIGQRHPEARRWAAFAYPYIIYYYSIKGDYEKSLLYAEQGEEIVVSMQDDIATSKFFHQKSQALTELGRYDEARRTLEHAIALIRKYPKLNREYASQERLMGRILREMGRAEEGLEHYLRAYHIARKNGNEDLADFANSLGQHYYTVGDYSKALTYYQEALRLNKNQSNTSIILDNIGLTYSRMNQFEKALQYHQQGLTQLSIAYTDTQRTSLPPAQTIRSEFQKEYFLVNVQDKADTWLHYAQARRNDRTKLRHALRTYMLADSMIDYMRWEHSQEGSKLFWRQKTRSMYEKAIHTCYLLNDPEAALYFFEKSRAVLLSDKLNELNANQLLKPEELEQEKGLRKQIADLQIQLSQRLPSDTALPRLRNRLIETQKQQDLFIKTLESNNPQYYRYKYDRHVPDLNQLRRQLAASGGDSQSYLTYFVGDSTLYGIYISQERVTFRKLNRSDYLRHQQEFTRRLISREQRNRHFNQYLGAAHGLYQQLIAPFAIPKETRLIISPDGDFIPFAALSLSPHQPDYLIRHHALSYTYSARFLETVPGSRSGWWSDKAFLGMAPVEYRTLQLATLPDSDLALKKIQKYFVFPRSLIRQAATRRAFVEQAPDYRIVQLFTHADADSARTPQLYFADSVLSLPDLAAVREFRTRLMVLSACKTGIGKHQRGEGVFSLARGFAGLGIPTTLTTLWSVENKAMYGLNELFYQYIADELPLDLALQKAQNEWLATSSRGNQLPYVWAGVVLVGRTDPIEEYSYGTVGIATLTLLLIVGLIGVPRYLGKRKRPLLPRIRQ
ncbi:CHAT domain-containing protein [Telluribacter sp. SYSU D00476]|uniref:CHAT domain-containing protein n=1 Tax=Telluribacter sp. SYSU D00476 TaxID=2811430 RepID=UPI001FF4D7A2|nr:CHAT domain-containing protein [Telluribacter sp. SYSU D00476]